MTREQFHLVTKPGQQTEHVEQEQSMQAPVLLIRGAWWQHAPRIQRETEHAQNQQSTTETERKRSITNIN